MTELLKNLLPDCAPVADKDNVILSDNYRITVLTDRLVRVERSKTGEFCDEATQTVFFRNLPKVEFKTEKTGKKLVVVTNRCRFVFNAGNGKALKVVLDGKVLPLKDRENLGGTCRTLDMRAGKVNLGKGILTKSGLSTLKDDGLIIKTDGTFIKREKSSSDVYYFAYGRDYRGAVKAFYAITGKVPMLPRYALGNWWSRYRAYTQKEYLDLMDRFAESNLPFTVATVDMDWHWVNVNRQFGTNFKREGVYSPGWTGYSWNTELFPDYRAFLNSLHEKNLHVTLNLHPASGVRCFEDRYKEFAEASGIKPEDKATVPFDLSDNNFINNYFKILHRPYEDEGVDFWWIDWQQGKKSSVDGLDPLWALNHYHYLDSTREGRGLILSRFAGAGSHRYPLGFSGDCVTVWSSLKFQPYMTSTAANIGYGWWSHDIGGHNWGVCDDELYLRWCQLGVFSPINRLHSSSHDLQGKEPWNRSETVNRIVSDFLRLRHRLIPYIYTAMRNAHENGAPLCMPVYYEYPENENAYKIKNEYFFGSELLVCPITEHTNKELRMAKTEIWIPEGRFTDIFTGKIYNGENILTIYRDLEYMPVLAKEGAIIPTSDEEGNSCGNPARMEILVYRGNNSYVLYEDDGISRGYESGEYAETVFSVSEENGILKFSVSEPRYGAENHNFTLPEDREYKITFKDVFGGVAETGGERKAFSGSVYLKAGEEVILSGFTTLSNGDNEELCAKARVILSRFQKGMISKMIRYFGLGKIKDGAALLKKVKRRFPKNVYKAVLEVFSK